MPDEQADSHLLSALTTEHFVLQSAVNGTIAEASARSTLYVMALSSALIALGFTADKGGAFDVFALSVLPVVFVLGCLSSIRLVDTAIENMQLMSGIARIRRHYRTLGPAAQKLFAAEHGRWPEAPAQEPSLQLGAFLAQMSTTAWMVALINNAVGGAIVTLAANRWWQTGTATHLLLGVATAIALSIAFYVFQRWRIATAGEPTRD
jgi:uncharacterized membrane protein